MRKIRALLVRLGGVWGRRRGDEGFASELDAHVRMHIEDNVRAGMTRIEARRQALIKLGGLAQAQENYRERRGLPFLETLFADLKFGARMLRKNPGFTSVAVLTLALGIAINATMFSMVSAFLLRRPVVREAERVAVIAGVNPAATFLPDTSTVSAPNYVAWREANHVFEDMAAADPYRTVTLSAQSNSGASEPLAEKGQPEALHAAAVTSNYFRMLGVAPKLGRTFEPGEDQPGRDHVLILSWDLWERRFSSDASIVGKLVRLNREDYTVIGVMPGNFRLLGFPNQLWIPLTLNAVDQSVAARNDRSLYLFGRLKPGATTEEARAEMSMLERRAGERFPDTEKGWGTAVRTLPDFLIYAFQIRSALVVIMTAVGFVLMIACANVAGLLLSRAAGRRKELAIRVALGGGRLRILRQLLTEGVLIALLGGGVGILLAYWGIYFVRANLTFNEAISEVPLSLDGNVLFFTAGVSLLCALLCGIVPAWNATRADINTNLKDEGRAASASHSQSRLRTMMVTAEIALALFLLVGTGLLLRGIFLVEHQKLGFRTDHLLTAGVTLDRTTYKDGAEQLRFVQDLLTRLQQLPSADSVAVTSDLPSSGPGSVTLRIKGQPELPSEQRLSTRDLVVSTAFFETAGIPLQRGRSFRESDNGDAPRVVVVNLEFVHRHLRDQEPLGKQIHLDVGGVTSEWSEIVGVVDNVKAYSEEVRDEPVVYEAFLQRPVSSFSIMVRSTSDPNALATGLRSSVAQMDAELPLERVMSMPAVIEHQREGNPFFANVMGSFALLALILASIGIYGLIAYSVSQRTHEIGIRMALGANRPDVLRMILWEGLRMTAVGGAIGTALALPLPKVFDAIFFGLHVREPLLYLIVPTAVLLVAMAATYIPARRATQVDPIRALRLE